MYRHLLCLALFGAALSAQAISPARESAGGSGGQCPETATADVAAGEAAATPEAQSTSPAAPAPVSNKAGNVTRGKQGARWHAFLPGMLK